ncbi:bifunctional demethylmenaquinone methyltransferase/2-methoxy-6-polyprenyl-1,4-benzoquinol methylase UbiE [Mycobacterium sp. DL592]|uniref:bifunctional demethylmenaquinone methyltransferase/2-methoxy-6-polyprenyl-1,4-benzoquinol methylase UbiE n=1 Tax=Mycobacterium sp. DL592 TaxID=2675524 RepID=UPI00141DCA75|nr:bifunctional demethylmenaquinone methyltransferase/2-methoxy-6-polyprenyl-1,4-benzoquinol methylase UbiE [Mycobacterium sp. DL592]
METRQWDKSDEAKSGYVKDLFSALAKRYDLMTDFWTFGLHRLWKRRTMDLCALRPGERVLDVATGTGDLAFLEAAVVGPTGEVIGVDSCTPMLDVARKRTPAVIDFQEGDAMDLKFPDTSFDIVTIGFGLRNVADRGQALREFHRVLRPGGRLVVLDFSTPTSKVLKSIHDFFYFTLMPRVGWAVAWHRDAHHYTADSIRTWLSRDGLRDLMQESGFVNARYVSLSTGFATVHLGVRPGE